MAEQVGFVINESHFARTFRQKFPKEGLWTSKHGRKRDENGALKYYYVGIKLKDEYRIVVHGRNGNSESVGSRI
jgi:hypothetical protein